MQYARSEVQQVFRALRDSFQITSWPSGNYNCIAWAAEDQGRWWWPDPDGESYWPNDIVRQETVDRFIEAFAILGYEPCDSDELEDGYDKVAIYAKGNTATHMARQLSSGAWTSKLGEWWDIGHETIEEVHAPHYGRRCQILRRRTPDTLTLPTET